MTPTPSEMEDIELEAMEARLTQIVDECNRSGNRDLIAHIAERALASVTKLRTMAATRRTARNTLSLKQALFIANAADTMMRLIETCVDLHPSVSQRLLKLEHVYRDFDEIQNAATELASELIDADKQQNR